MNRVDESESTPKKRNLRQDEAVAREGITKSGRKVKRPAHLDSPERPPSASPSETRKSVAVRAKKGVEPHAGTPSKRTAMKEQNSPGEAKGARKTIASSRKTTSEHLDTPKSNKEKQQMADTVDDAAGTSKSGRKIKIPTKLMEFESDVLSSPRKHVESDRVEVLKDKLAKPTGRSKTPAKSTAKNIAVEQNQHPDDVEEKNLVVRKTPGRRAKSVAPDQLEVESVGTPKRRGVSSLFSTQAQTESASSEQTLPKTPGKRAGKTLLGLDVKASPKTPGRRAKSVAPGKEVVNDTLPSQNVLETKSTKTNKNTTQTPGRRVGKTMVDPAVQTSRSESSEMVQAVPKTPGRRAAKSMMDASVTTLGVESPRPQRPSAKTPGRRQHSGTVNTIDPIEEMPNVGKTDERELVDNETQIADTGIETKPSTTVDEFTAAEEPLTRSGRKIKPKKVFDFENDEKSTEPTNTNEKVFIDSKRKRKVDATDESTKSPTKKKIIENVGSQTPKFKNRLETSLSVLGAESPQMENPSDVSVSRSGRKIKPKKMFGFDDGVEITTTFVHVTGSSPTLNEETAEADNREGNLTMTAVQEKSRSAKVNTTSTLSRRTTSSAEIVEQKTSPMVIEQDIEELIDGIKIDKQQTFITKRGVDDHHHDTSKVVEKQQLPIDETDRAMVSPEPVIIRTSIGFGKPTVQKQTLSKQSGESEEDDCEEHRSRTKPTVNENVTPSRIHAPAVGSSRSGRKIKPKKFFDTDDPKTASRQSFVTPKVNQPVPVPVLSLKQQIVEEQENEACRITAPIDNAAADEVMHSAEGIDIPEGPVKLANEATVENLGDDGTEQKQQHVTSKEPEEVAIPEPVHSDVEMEPKENVQDMKVEAEVVEIIGQRSITTKEEEQLLVEEKSEVPDNQHTTLEEGKGNQFPSDDVPNVTTSERSISIVQQHGEDAPLIELSLDTDAKQTPLAENSAVNDNELAPALADHEDAGNITIEKMPNESNVANETMHAVASGSVADTKSEENDPKVVPTGSVISSSGMPQEEMLEEASFGSIEYLEDEMNNIVEHIKKPALEEPTEKSTSVSASAVPSIVIITDTPARKALNETYSPLKQNSSIIDITTDTPRPVVAAAAPRTPDSKLAAQEPNDECSPDKPPEIIEILDSPAVAAFCKQINDESAHGGDGGSATSTPLAVRPSVVRTTDECVNSEQLDVQFESRKRSLSASAADTTMKRNVTFHSPANCTMLVETIDERLMLKSLHDQQQQRQETMETSSKGIGEKLRKPRKRSLSEHKPSEMKRNKTSKLPNFKSIHANHFNRMESVADFMKRKETRAKQILSSCSPATKLLSQPVTDAPGTSGVPSVEKKIPSSSTKPFIFKSTGGGIPVPSAGLFVKRPKEGPTAAKSAGSVDRHALPATSATSTLKKPIASDTERMANRLKQFQATFKPKQIGTDASAVPMAGSQASTSTNSVVGERPVEQLRSKQSKILKGVRTNRRFELQMKHRDNLQHQ